MSISLEMKRNFIMCLFYLAAKWCLKGTALYHIDIKIFTSTREELVSSSSLLLAISCVWNTHKKQVMGFSEALGECYVTWLHREYAGKKERVRTGLFFPCCSDLSNPKTLVLTLRHFSRVWRLLFLLKDMMTVVRDCMQECGRRARDAGT